MHFIEQYFHKEHLWVALTDEGQWYLGVSNYAQQNLGEIMYLDLPDIPFEIYQGNSLGTIESAKVVSELIAPVDGEVVELNEELGDEPWVINEDAQGKGWIARIVLKDTHQVKDLLSYSDYIRELGESE